MAKVFDVYLAKWGGKEEAYAYLTLPAGPYELLDALEKAQVSRPEEMCLQVEEHHRFEYLAPFLHEECSLYELNALAERLSGLDDRQATAFHGLLELEVAKREGPITPQRLYDLAYSADCCHVLPEIMNDGQLGRFYAEGGFVPELDDLPEQLFELLDFEQIGRRMRTAEGGIFMERGDDEPGGYVVCHSELNQAPPIPTAPPETPKYIFRLLLEEYPFEDVEHRAAPVPLELPAEERELEAALEKLGAASWEEVVVADYDGVLPDLIYMGGLLENIALLNEFAGELEQLRSEGDISKYKAVLKATKCDDLCQAVSLAEQVGDYRLEPDLMNAEDVAREELRTVVDDASAERIARHLDLCAYGEEIMVRDQAANTPYGLVSRKDGQPVEDIYTQPVQGGIEMM